MLMLVMDSRGQAISYDLSLIRCRGVQNNVVENILDIKHKSVFGNIYTECHWMCL